MINFPSTTSQNLHLFNEEFEKTVSTLQEEWLGRNIKETPTTDKDFLPIMEFINKNISLLSQSNDIKEVSRFVKITYQIPKWINENLHQDHDVLTNMIIKSSLAILQLSNIRIPNSIDILKSLKETNETLFLDVVTHWINQEKIPLKKLKDLELSEKQLIQIAPQLHYLNFTSTNYSEDFIGQLFEKSEKVKCIIFKKNMISGSCFNFLKNSDSLEVLTLTKCSQFNQPLPDNLPSLQTLEISYCKAFDQMLPDNLPSLKDLVIMGCDAFDQMLPGNLSSLKTIRMAYLTKFNQRLPDNLPSLQTLDIKSCNAFDHRLSDNLPSLQTLEISWCEAFDQKLPDKLSSLENLKMSWCGTFDQMMPDNLSSLKILEISDCDAFNQSLPHNLPSLQTLKISFCETFDQMMPDNLSSLKILEISDCKVFNQSLPHNLPSLQTLIVNCNRFDPFSHDVKTALLLMQFDLEQFQKMWGQLTSQTQRQIAQEVLNARDSIKTLFDKSPEKILKVAEAFEIPLQLLKQAYPEVITYFTLIDIDKERTQGGSDDEIITLFSSLKDQPNYFETLKIMLRSFPYLSSFILRKLKDELLKDIENLQIPISELPSETKWFLLPLFKADDIAQMVHLTSKEERAGWLQEELHFDRFSGPIEIVLKSVKEANIDGSTTDNMENLTSTILELLQMIPFKTLAALTSDDENLKTLLAYLPFMEEQQLAVVIPALPQKVFIDYLDKQFLNTHPDKLMHATQLQKKLYLEKRDIEQFVLSLKEKLTAFNQLMGINQNPNNQEMLEQDFNIIHASITQQLHSIPKILSRTKDSLLKGSPNEDFRHHVELYNNEMSSMITSIGNEMKEINHRIDSKKEEIPEEFIDNITGEIMTDPYKDLCSGTILDKQTWDKVNGENPFNRQPTILVEATDVRERIQKYLTGKQLEKK